MDVVVRVRVPEGVDEATMGEIAEIFARAQVLKMLTRRGHKAKKEKASWRELREYLEEYRDLLRQ
ncbi:hypothetical protein JCM16138_03620 [Thermococcus atlanticus]